MVIIEENEISTLYSAHWHSANTCNGRANSESEDDKNLSEHWKEIG